MASRPDLQISNMVGETFLPRDNGELVFEAPWEGRAFGIAVALRDEGLYEWRDFRDRLVIEAARAQKEVQPPSCYEQWLAALEKLATERGFISQEELDRRTLEYVVGERGDELQ